MIKENVRGTGILICGLNGTGKSTLGKVLAEKLHFYFIDDEDLYFPKTNPDYIYASPRTQEEVEELLLRKIKVHENFVFASVLIDVPKNIRIQRVKNRSFQKFGNRMLLGGDLYEQEEAFFNFVESRAENTVEEWIQCLKCPIIRIDGTKPIEENIYYICNLMHQECFSKKERKI